MYDGIHNFYSLLKAVNPSLLSPPVNVLRVSLHSEGLAAQIVNYHEWALICSPD